MRISDWSSDVCSSDLLLYIYNIKQPPFETAARAASSGRGAGRFDSASVEGPHAEEARRAVSKYEGLRARGPTMSPTLRDVPAVTRAVAILRLPGRSEAPMGVNAVARDQIGRAHVCTPVTNPQ